MSPSRSRRALLSLATVGGLLFGLLSFAASADAATTSLYVDKTVSCSDTGSGTSSTPYCTIAKGVSQLQPGTTLYVGNGTYAETIKPTVSGTSSSPVTITGWPGRSPKIGNGVNNGAYVSARSYVVISNLTFFSTVTDGIYVTGSNHITISGNTVSDSGKPLQGQTAPGISLRNTSASTVSGNTSDHNSDHGIFLTSGSTGNTVADNETSFNANGWHRNANGIDVISPGNTILRNVTHDNEDSGIQFYTGGNDNLAALNVTYNNGDHGIDDFNVTGGRLIGNTVYHNCTSGINVEGTSGNYTVENNIAVDNAVYPAYNGIKCSRRAGNIGIWDSAPATTTANHNLVYLSTSGTMYVFGSSYTSLAAMQAAKGQEQDGVQANPGFVSASSGNFQLTEGSAAIDRGDSAVSGAQSSDILGNARVDDPNVPNTHASGPRLYDDLGAYEFQSSGTPPSKPTAALSVSPSSGTAPVQVTADASGSSDPQGQTLSYVFDWGDGSSTPSQSGTTATHTYSAAGSYTVTVTATDTTGLSDTATRTVTVTAPASAPTARLTVSPTSGTAPVQVTADASASTDPQGQALSYAFDWGDGSSTPSQSAATANHTYTTAGTYTVTVTATDTTGLSGTATKTVTVTAASSAPTARLTVSPSSGTAPVQVTADASASTDPQGQALTYAFSWGDGNTTPSQSAATASHTYTTAGSYTVTVTVTDTSGLSSTASQAVTVSSSSSTPPAYVNQIATNYSTSSKTTGSVTVWRTGGVKAGDLIVVTLQLAGTSSTGAVTATDDAGDTYTTASSVANASGDRLVVLSAVAKADLAVNAKITATFPTASLGYRMTGDEFAGVTQADQTASSTGSASTFSSGTTPTTSAAKEVAFAAVDVTAGTGNPTWGSGWKDAGSYAVGSRYLGRGYQLTSSTTAVTATGTASGPWLATVVTFQP